MMRAADDEKVLHEMLALVLVPVSHLMRPRAVPSFATAAIAHPLGRLRKG